jgi:hypothetical protein
MRTFVLHIISKVLGAKIGERCSLARSVFVGNKEFTILTDEITKVWRA